MGEKNGYGVIQILPRTKQMIVTGARLNAIMTGPQVTPVSAARSCASSTMAASGVETHGRLSTPLAGPIFSVTIGNRRNPDRR